ncbi:5764_t:CDS:2, partial [Acaulospora colombiana]
TLVLRDYRVSDELSAAPTKKVILQPRPPLVDGFLGREDILVAMRRAHFEDISTRRYTPLITVLTGLGGAGKTQVALKFASEYEEKYQDSPVYFLDASSKMTLEADLQTLVRSQSEVYTDALLWLATGKKDWLVIMDNADDPSLELARYLPRCAHGHVIITTRNPLRETLAPNSTHDVSFFSLEDSTNLLLDASGYEDNEVNRTLAKDIAQELGGLPLALAHAGAYILVKQCLHTYLNTYKESHSQFLRRKFDLPHDYPYSVAATIEMSFEKLSHQAQILLRLLSHLGPRSIPHIILEQAARRQFRSVAMETGLPLKTETLQYASTLMKIICPRGSWFTLDFDDLIEECKKYSLVNFSSEGGQMFYSIHILVQNFLQSTSGLLYSQPPGRLVARLLGSTITYSEDHEYVAFNRLLSPHLQLVNPDDVIEPGDHYGYGHVLQEMGGGKLAVSHMERCLELWTTSLGSEDGFTLKAMEVLAHCYSTVGQEERALSLKEKVVEDWKKLVGVNHRNTIAAINNLANSYSNLGRDEEALPWREEVARKWIELLGEDHPITLDGIANLAVSYSHLGRYREALPLKVMVMEKRSDSLGWGHPDTLDAIRNVVSSFSHLGLYGEALELSVILTMERTKLLGEDHPDTLKDMESLAVCYSNLGQEDKALPFRAKLALKQRELLGEDHLITLVAMNNLANSYSNVGLEQKALPLRRIVAKKRHDLLGADHLETLRAMDNLAISLSSLGQEWEAFMLRVNVVEKWKRVLGEDHLDTLMAINNLAISYSNFGQEREAVLLRKTVMERRKVLLGEGHLETLSAANNLAASYSKLGQHEEALALNKEVMEKRREILGDDNMKTLQAINNLAASYSSLGRHEEALPLKEELVEKWRKLYGGDNHYTLVAMHNLANTYAQVGRDEDASRLQRIISEKRTNLLGG